METEYRGFLVHCYADLRRNRIFAVGRLEDGRSFAAVNPAGVLQSMSLKGTVTGRSP